MAGTDLANRMDYLGVNYYARLTAQANWVSPWPLSAISARFTFNPLNMQTDMNYARGIYEVLTWARGYDLPLIVTETGSEQAHEDDAQARWLTQTVGYVKQAMGEGAPVAGYFLWTLMDNYEWNHGMGMKFGLYQVDATNKARAMRDAGVAYAEMSKARDVPAALETKYAKYFAP